MLGRTVGDNAGLMQIFARGAIAPSPVLSVCVLGWFVCSVCDSGFSCVFFCLKKSLNVLKCLFLSLRVLA